MCIRDSSWAAFLGGLRERGLAGVRLVVSDSHAGLVAAVSRLFQGVSVNIIFTISTNAFSPIAPTRIRRIRQRGCAAFGA